MPVDFGGKAYTWVNGAWIKMKTANKNEQRHLQIKFSLLQDNSEQFLEGQFTTDPYHFLDRTAELFGFMYEYGFANTTTFPFPHKVTEGGRVTATIL